MWTRFYSYDGEKCVGSIDDLKPEGWFYFDGEQFEIYKNKIIKLAETDYNKATEEEKQFIEDNLFVNKVVLHLFCIEQFLTSF